jgi:hypothetical protein
LNEKIIKLIEMDETLANQLFEETLLLAEENRDEVLGTLEKFRTFMEEMLPPELIEQLQEIHGNDESNSFLELVYQDRYVVEEVLANEIEPGVCNICERQSRLTRHHVYPREIHKQLLKKGYDSALLNNTVSICRMCHSTIHNFFSNEELARSYYTVDLLLEDEKFHRYAKWAATQKDGRHHKQ